VVVIVRIVVLQYVLASNVECGVWSVPRELCFDDWALIWAACCDARLRVHDRPLAGVGYLHD
jgi:hypothetical protein